ncbi:DNA replication regulator SLD3-domain-containing protein [Aspergillus unguis]
MTSSNAFMASRGSLDVLEPIPLNQLHDVPIPPLKRRKLSTSNEYATDNIIIRAHTASLYDEPYILEPIAVIPRHHFPFDWLDFASTLSQIQSGSLFVANIPVLESDPHPESVVLIVRLSSDGRLYVIERVKRGIYSLSTLARGVEEGDVRVVVKASTHRANVLPLCTLRKSAGNASDGDWWLAAQVDDPVPDFNVELPVKRTNIDFVFGVSANVDRDERMTGVTPVDSMERSSSFDVRMVSVPPETLGAGETVISNEVDEADIGEDPQSPQELLDGLREHYLQALYVSKASVAYFAKGPLPRCRNAFQASEPATGDISDLIGFYREAILTAKKMDLKYRETLPAALHDIVLSMSDDEAPKKRKSKKKTIGRNGLYPEETDYIRRCWKNRAMTEAGASVDTSRDTEIKKHVSDLRLRETQLQILLILETIALEASLETSADEAKKTGQEDSSADHKAKTKTKKPQDLNVMLELHLDRLCIWHAVSFGDVAVTDARASSGNQQGKTGGNDAMRDFCTEVIIPFYASRLPDRCKSITRKLGVSASTIAALPKSAKKPRKESGAERNPPQKSRRPLHRVLTDEQTSQGRSQPSLHRSITAPSQIETNRETTPLLPTLNNSVRGGIQKAKRAENREVDLFAVARQHETKLKRVQMLAEQKKELDAAILALRKPNRELVAKDIAQDAEKRTSSRKPKNPVRNPLGQGVQVMATPSKVRKRDAVGLPLSKSVARSKSKATHVSSSPFNAEPQVVPGSTIKPNSFNNTPFATDAAVHETPSRRASRPLSLPKTTELSVAESPLPGSGNLFRVPRRPAPRPAETNPLTPIRSQHADAAEVTTPLDDRQRLPPPPPPVFALPSKITPSKSSMVFETPPKPKPGPVSGLTSRASVSMPTLGPPPTSNSTSGSGLTPIKPAPVVPVTPEKSIYSALGWEDDDDELAL